MLNTAKIKTWNLPLHRSMRRSKNLATGAGTRWRKRAQSYTRQILRSSKNGSGRRRHRQGLPSFLTAVTAAPGGPTKAGSRVKFAKEARLRHLAGHSNPAPQGKE